LRQPTLSLAAMSATGPDGEGIESIAGSGTRAGLECLGSVDYPGWIVPTIRGEFLQNGWES
jgi:hypothetical protein